MEVSLDGTQWPVVQITCPKVVDIDDVKRMMQDLGAILQTRGPMALVCDIDALVPSTVTPLLRRTLAEEADKLAQRGAFIAEAVVIRNPLLRGSYRAYTWIRQRHAYPSATFADLAQARAWLQTQLTPDARTPR